MWSEKIVVWNGAAAAAAKSLQSCPTPCDPIDSSPPGSAVPGILHARTLEWVAISFSNAWKWKVKVMSLSRVRLFATPWTSAYRFLHSWDSPGKSSGVGCHRLLQWNGAVWVKKFNINCIEKCLEGCSHNFLSLNLSVCVWIYVLTF